MAEDNDKNPGGSKTYTVGNIGSGARVAIGENIKWVEGVKTLPDGEEIAKMFEVLFKDITEDGNLDDDTREISNGKIQAVAEGLVKIEEDPSFLRKALVEAKNWFTTSATWAFERIGNILKSEAVQKTLSTVTEVGLKSALTVFLV